ncbi:MAG: hypothetical protein U1E39_02690 [Planctomycetota bacterium]
MIYTVGDCPVDPGDGIPYVISVTGQPPVLLYCPSCECAWASTRDVELPPTRGLREFGLSEQVIRYATEAEVRAAGLELGQTREPWWELPHPLQAAERSAPTLGGSRRVGASVPYPRWHERNSTWEPIPALVVVLWTWGLHLLGRSWWPAMLLGLPIGAAIRMVWGYKVAIPTLALSPLILLLAFP